MGMRKNGSGDDLVIDSNIDSKTVSKESIGNIGLMEVGSWGCWGRIEKSGKWKEKSEK